MRDYMLSGTDETISPSGEVLDFSGGNYIKPLKNTLS